MAAKKSDPVADIIDAADDAKLAAKEIAPSEGVLPQNMFRDDTPKDQNKDARLRDVIDGVMATHGISVRTVLEDKHIVALVRGRIFAERHNSQLMEQLCQYLQEARISKDGRGRKDLIATMKAAVSNPEESGDKGPGRFSRFF